jgi:ABC-type tungstate transport system permease subunit
MRSKIAAGFLFVSGQLVQIQRELSIWKKSGIEPKGQKWYLEVGQGMEKTQRIANEKRAYTLTDRGTWLATKDKDKLAMVIVPKVILRVQPVRSDGGEP